MASRPEEQHLMIELPTQSVPGAGKRRIESFGLVISYSSWCESSQSVLFPWIVASTLLPNIIQHNTKDTIIIRLRIIEKKRKELKFSKCSQTPILDF
jgi:hypothetical protein